jgi:hypothetical protein
MQIAASMIESIVEHAAELELPAPGHAHLFWALFWFDRLQNRPMDAGALHGLSHHLRKARPSLPAGTNRDELEAEILPQLLRATLFAIEGCLRTCLLREVPALLERGIQLTNLLPEADLARSFRLRLVRRAWEA